MADIVEEEQAKEFKTWNAPFVEQEKTQDNGKTNALNRSKNWKWEAPEEEEEILPPTAEEIEAIRKEAYEEGFKQGQEEGKAAGFEEGKTEGLETGHAEGFEKGLAEGLEEGRETIEQQLQQWQALNETLQTPITMVEEELEVELLQLAVGLARSVIQVETQLNENVIFQALKAALKVLPVQEQRYEIHLHPEDFKLVRQHFSEEEIEQHNWVLVESVSTSQGGCEIITENNAVDMSLEKRIREVVDRFLMEQGISDSSLKG
ncbi:MAG: flagellar assembly protein FliH [Aestuariibacter sp.]